MPSLAQSFGVLAEGLTGAFYPEVAYVRQGDKVFFYQGKPGLTESLGDGVTVVGSENDLEIVERTVGEGADAIVERTVKNGEWFVEGPFQRSDVRNANKRIYGRKIWERLIADKKSSVMQNVTGRGMIGHLEHPKDGRTDGKEGALLTTSLNLREDGVVWGKAEILDTPNGRILQEYTRKKVRWGVSSRGHGSVKDDGHVNEDDYMLETFDGVMKPSTPGAHPKPVTAGKSESDTVSLSTAELTEDAKEAIAEVDSLRERDVNGLDEAGRSALHKDLLSSMLRVSSLAKSDALDAKRANDLQDWLANRMREISEASLPDADAVIDQALENLSGDDDEDEKHAAFRRVIESMHRRIMAAQEEAETLRARIREAEEASETARAERRAAIEMLHEAEEEAEAVQAKIAAMQEQLETAYALIAERTKQEVQDSVAEAINAAVEQVPGLEQYREVLETADTPERVGELAEELLPAVVRQQSPEPAAESIHPRRTLPTGIVESEGIRGGGRKPEAPTSRGARRAGKAVAHMASAK